ncbi:hypothetical protein GCM10018793_66100 [Streptomyces sulfonofaciens]|uniref:Uncharacterized protein n=1 Tax=Streptomyces sulfonofaciens TaxID=68272 RepID=A0A919L8M9_9ACTN|nr:hypothetical protein [Streptomyces sulfonofaciens]GHH88033.1 hypothetical protein GCM10018793_66100 [Streptomyces sulfonofaciens]
MLPADAGGGADLRRGAEALKIFKRRVDTLLSEFEGSAGSSSKVGAQTISRASLSGHGTFGEADDLYHQYNRVHEQLTTLSKSLGHQIEAMGIAVHGADIGFDNLDEDLRRRFWALQTQIHEDNQPPRHESPEHHGDQQHGHSDDKHSGTGYS